MSPPERQDPPKPATDAPLTAGVSAEDHGLPCFRLDALEALVGEDTAARAFLPWGEMPFLLVDLDAGVRGRGQDDRPARWMQELPCPVIGVGPTADAPSACRAACDTLVPDLGAAAAMVARIRRHPLAAATFVRVLRHTDGLPLEAALHAESLAYGLLQAGPEHRAWLARPAADGSADGVAPRDKSGAGGSAVEPAVLCQTHGSRLDLVLNRPERGNAMSVEMRDALCAALNQARAGLHDGVLEAVTLRGRGPHFCTGGDLDEFGTVPDAVTGHAVRGLALPGRLLAEVGARTEALLHGACIGSGIELPAFAGRVTARGDASFRLPELDFGLIPGAGGCVSIPRRIGRQRAAWMVLSGQGIDVETALAWGLVDAVIE